MTLQIQITKMFLFADSNPVTHCLVRQTEDLYTICSKYDQSVNIQNVCSWFIETLFGKFVDYKNNNNSLVYFMGEYM